LRSIYSKRWKSFMGWD